MDQKVNIPPEQQQEPLPPIRQDACGALDRELVLRFTSAGPAGFAPMGGKFISEITPNGAIHFGTIAFPQGHKGAFFDTGLRYFVGNRPDGSPAPAMSMKFKVISDVLCEGPFGYGAIVTMTWRYFTSKVVLECNYSLPVLQAPVKFQINRSLFTRTSVLKSLNDGYCPFSIQGGINCRMIVPAGTPKELLPIYCMTFYSYRLACWYNFWMSLALVGILLVCGVAGLLYQSWIFGGIFMALWLVSMVLLCVFT